MSMTVAPNKFVSLGYELYVGNSEERVLMEETSPPMSWGPPRNAEPMTHHR